MKVRVEGPLVFNIYILRCASTPRWQVLGLAYVPEDQVQSHIEKGRLVRVLADWCAPFSPATTSTTLSPAADPCIHGPGRGAAVSNLKAFEDPVDQSRREADLQTIPQDASTGPEGAPFPPGIEARVMGSSCRFATGWRGMG